MASPSPFLTNSAKSSKSSANAANVDFRTSSASFNVDTPSFYETQHTPSFQNSNVSKHPDGYQLLTPVRTVTALYLFLAFVSETANGLSSGTNRYLETQGGLMPLQILTIKAGIGGLFSGLYTIPKMGFQSFGIPKLWLLLIIHVSHSVFNVYSTKYTLSYYVQLITLSAPFIVALEAHVILKEQLPRFTLTAMFCAAIGSFVTISGDLFTGGSFDIGILDTFGLLLAVGASFCQASRSVFESTISEKKYPAASIYFTELLAEFVVCGSISFAIDDWTFWKHMDRRAFILLAVRVFIAAIFSEILRIHVIRRTGAPLISTLIPWELVVAVAFGASPILNEPISFVNIIGVVIVVVVIFLYLLVQYLDSKQETSVESDTNKQKTSI